MHPANPRCSLPQAIVGPVQDGAARSGGGVCGEGAGHRTVAAGMIGLEQWSRVELSAWWGANLAAHQVAPGAAGWQHYGAAVLASHYEMSLGGLSPVTPALPPPRVVTTSHDWQLYGEIVT